MLASAIGVCECAVVACVSLQHRLRSIAVDLLEKNNNKKEEKETHRHRRGNFFPPNQ